MAGKRNKGPVEDAMVVYTMGAESSIYQYLRDLVKEFTTDLPLFAESVTCIF